MSGKLRILLADDHSIVREGLRLLLEDTGRFEIVGEASGGDEAVRLAGATRPDVVLMDLKMGGTSAADATRVIRHTLPGVHVLALTSFADEALVAEMVSAGALGYLLKDVKRSELLTAIETVARGEPWLDAQAQRSLVGRLRRPADVDRGALLTEREKSVLRLIARGRSNRDIARELNLTEGTVKGYVSNVLAKLKLEDRTQAALFAVKHGLD